MLLEDGTKNSELNRRSAKLNYLLYLGRFLVSAKRFDALLKTHSEEELKNLKLVKVHQDFQVIALGLPVSPMIIHMNEVINTSDV